ncbi:hypothetical protein ACOMHN_010125 [Nucella lapillus]
MNCLLYGDEDFEYLLYCRVTGNGDATVHKAARGRAGQAARPAPLTLLKWTRRHGCMHCEQGRSACHFCPPPALTFAHPCGLDLQATTVDVVWTGEP